MTQPTAHPVACDKCGAVLPTDAHGHPRYWNTLHLNPTTRIPRGLRICARCRTDQASTAALSQPLSLQAPLL